MPPFIAFLLGVSLGMWGTYFWMNANRRRAVQRFGMIHETMHQRHMEHLLSVYLSTGKCYREEHVREFKN